jgi:hypothetical protein
VQIPPDGSAPPASVPNINQALANLQSGKGTVADQATVMNGSAANLVNVAGSGFELDPEAAAALIASCDESLNILMGLGEDLRAVQEAPKLGSLKAAQSVSSFTQKVAADPQGIAKAVNDLQGTIAQMKQAYQKAVANYQAIDQQVSDQVNKLAAEVKQENAPAPQYGRMRAE